MSVAVLILSPLQRRTLRAQPLPYAVLGVGSRGQIVFGVARKYMALCWRERD